MAKQKIGVLEAVMVLNDEQYTRRMQAAIGKTVEFEQSLQAKLRVVDRLGQNLAKTGAALTKGLTLPLVAATTAVTAFTRRFAGNLDQVDKFAVRSGLARTTVQEMQFALEQVGASFESVQRVSARLQQTMYDSGKTSNEQTRALQDLGVSAFNADGSLRKIDSVLPEVISRLQSMQDKTKRNALAAKLFGQRLVVDLLPVLDAGAGSFEALTEHARRLGLVLSDDQVKAGTAFKDLWDQITLQLKAAMASIAVDLIPLLKTVFVPIITGMVIPALKQLGDMIGELSKSFGALDPRTRATILLITGLVAALGPLLLVTGKAIGLLVGVGKVIVSAIGALKLLGSAVGLATAPIWLKVLALTALVAAIYAVGRNAEAFGEFFAAMWEKLASQTLSRIRIIIGTIIGLIGVLSQFGATVGPVMAGLEALGVPMAGVAKRSLDVYASLAPVNNELKQLYDNLGDIKEGFDQSFAGRSIQTFGQLMDEVVKTASSDWEALKKAIGSTLDLLSTAPDVLDPPTVALAETTEEASALADMIAERWGVDVNEMLLKSADTIRAAVVDSGATLKEFGSTVLAEAKKFVRAKMFEAVAAYVASALTNIPFPFGLIAAGIAAAGVTALFNTIVPFAEGGIVTSPTLGLVGEAGPEAIIPLSSSTAFFGGTDRRVVRELRGLKRELRRKNTSPTVITTVDGRRIVQDNLLSVERTYKVITK